MRTLGSSSPAIRTALWLGSAAIAGLIGLIVVGVTYDESMDCSNPEIHESANTAFGWSVALVASLLPVGVAVWVSGGLRRGLPAVAAVVALLSLGIWWWMLDADCEWYALPAL